MSLINKFGSIMVLYSLPFISSFEINSVNLFEQRLSQAREFKRIHNILKETLFGTYNEELISKGDFSYESNLIGNEFGVKTGDDYFFRIQVNSLRAKEILSIRSYDYSDFPYEEAKVEDINNDGKIDHITKINKYNRNRAVGIDILPSGEILVMGLLFPSQTPKGVVAEFQEKYNTFYESNNIAKKIREHIPSEFISEKEWRDNYRKFPEERL